MPKILVVEDDLSLSGIIEDFLKLEHHTVEAVDTGDEALARLKSYEYDVVILDVGLPDMTGFEICREYRGAGGKVPILMLTGQSSTDDRVEGLDSGADDYLTKPFHPRELNARVRALIRRPANLAANSLQCGDIALDPSAHIVTKAGKEVALLPREFALLEFLMRHPNQVFSHEAILSRVWASTSDTVPDTVRFHVASLRKKIDTNGEESIIQTVHRAGYKLVLPE